MFICLVFGISLSCIPENSTRQNSSDFYNINALVDNQINLLDSINPLIHKVAIIDGNQQQRELQPNDSAGWSKELSIFRSADLNHTKYNSSYEIIKEGAGSNLRFLKYISLHPEETEVDTALIEFNSQKNLKSIHAYLENRNELFYSSKTLDLHFIDKDNTPIISKYKIYGWQKMISKDSVSFLIQAQVIH